jgi:hypothetical protein
MKRIRKELIVIALVFLVSPVAEAALDGHTLVEGWKAYKRVEKDHAELVDPYLRGLYMGYVMGFCDAASKHFNIPSGTTNERIFIVVGKYVDEHPEEWHKPADFLVIKALNEEFPIFPKKKK